MDSGSAGQQGLQELSERNKSERLQVLMLYHRGDSGLLVFRKKKILFQLTSFLETQCPYLPMSMGFLFPSHDSLVAPRVKNLPAMQETCVPSLSRDDPLERKWQPTPVFLPGEFHGQRSLVGYSPWGHKELDVTEQLTLSQSAAELENHCLCSLMPSGLWEPAAAASPGAC